MFMELFSDLIDFNFTFYRVTGLVRKINTSENVIKFFPRFLTAFTLCGSYNNDPTKLPFSKHDPLAKSTMSLNNMHCVLVYVLRSTKKKSCI